MFPRSFIRLLRSKVTRFLRPYKQKPVALLFPSLTPPLLLISFHTPLFPLHCLYPSGMFPLVRQILESLTATQSGGLLFLLPLLWSLTFLFPLEAFCSIVYILLWDFFKNAFEYLYVLQLAETQFSQMFNIYIFVYVCTYACIYVCVLCV